MLVSEETFQKQLPSQRPGLFLAPRLLAELGQSTLPMPSAGCCPQHDVLCEGRRTWISLSRAGDHMPAVTLGLLCLVLAQGLAVKEESPSSSLCDTRYGS